MSAIHFTRLPSGNCIWLDDGKDPDCEAGWHFSDETECPVGPFDTREEAVAQCERYMIELTQVHWEYRYDQ